jgi:hypothetical protein
MFNLSPLAPARSQPTFMATSDLALRDWAVQRQQQAREDAQAGMTGTDPTQFPAGKPRLQGRRRRERQEH